MMTRSRPMNAPTGAEDWQHKVDLSDPNDPYDRWLALVPNVVDNVLHVYEKAPGQWCVVVLDGDMGHSEESTLALLHAAPLPAGPFASAEEAMRAADKWCAKWAPRVVDLPGVHALRICTDGKIRTSADESDAGNEPSETALTPDETRALVEVLMVAAKEVSALSAGDCTR
jgi:hypothetical protein